MQDPKHIVTNEERLMKFIDTGRDDGCDDGAGDTNTYL